MNQSTRMGIGAKVWMSVGIFLAGYVLSVGLGQVQGLQSERRLKISNETLFPAAQLSQLADAGFQRMSKAFSDAVMVEDSAALEQAQQEGVAMAEKLGSAANLHGLQPERAEQFRKASVAVRTLAGEARGAYGAMIGAGGNITPEMQGRTRDVAEKMTAAKDQLAKLKDGVSSDLREGLALAETQSRQQRWIALAVFAVTLALAGFAVQFTIRRSIVGPVTEIVNGIRGATDAATEAANQMARSGDSVSKGATDQAACIEETSASLQEILSTTRQNVARAGEADKLMQHATSTVTRATSTVDQLTRSMNEISSASQQVARVLKSIDEIAFQTNILALNAAVEAARAGASGGGFAVVADEVRNLAQRAAAAARNSAELIDEANTKVASGVEFVQATKNAFGELAQVVSNSGRVVSEIAASAEQQSQSVTHISTAMGRIEQVTHTNAAHAQETAAAAVSVNEQVRATQDQIDWLEVVVGH